MLKYLNNFQLKLIALLTMTIDHVGLFWGIFSFRVIGRITFPIFSFLISEGAFHTNNIKKYFIRLFIFAISIEAVFVIINYIYDLHIVSSRNIFFTLSFGLLAIIIYRYQISILVKLISTTLLLFISHFLNFDYGIYGIITIFIFYVFRNNNLLIILSLIIINLFDWFFTSDSFQMYSLLSIPLILLYNGNKGRDIKYVFYLYYPLHLAVIYIVFYLLE